MKKLASSLFSVVILTLPSGVLANTDYPEVDLRQLPIEQVRKFPEVYLENESLMKHQNSRTGVITDAHYTGHESNRLSLAYMGSIDYTNFTEVGTIDLQYQFKTSYLLDTWWAFQFRRTSAQYKEIANERVYTSGHPDSDNQLLRSDDQQTITSLGVGVGFRFKLLFAFNKSERFFEHITAVLTHNTANDASTDQSYTGFGYNADYSLLYRSGNSLYYGLKLSYNLAAVVRPATSDEPPKDRSLVYGWSGVGLEIGAYY